MFTRLPLFLLLAAAPALFAQAQAKQKYDGPKPAKADVPYLLHARNLVELDQGEAREEKVKDVTRYTLPGATAKARTPLMEPIFLLQADKLVPEKLTCYRMQPSKAGQRELNLPAKPKKDSARPLRMTVTQAADRLFRIELSETLDNGEYVLTPEGSNQVFAFTVY
jgi:hypothetical protein